MSAYALPGLLFFPSGSSNDTNLVSDEMKGSESFLPDEREEMYEVEVSDKEKSWDRSDGLFISIKSATVDPIKLIKCFTARSTSTSSPAKNSFRERVTSLSNSLTRFSVTSNSTDASQVQWGEYDDSPPNSPSRKVRLSFDEMEETEESSEVFPCPSVSGHNGAVPVIDTSKESDFHDDAIQFNLSISFNGRKYTATRALPTFVKLRKDLMLESKGRSTMRFNKPGVTRMSAVSQESKQTQADEVSIPELPIGDGSKMTNVVQLAGRGFRGLQDSVCAYCPDMEKWIRSVADLVPSSPSLENFLWEPIHSDHKSPDHSPTRSGLYASKSPLRNSNHTLNSILESEDTFLESESDFEE
jgi:hypothetical protein